jgi:crossover junction endodeoxyribonuclease RusA
MDGYAMKANTLMSDCVVCGLLGCTHNQQEAYIYGTPVPQGSARAFNRGGKVVVTSDNPKLKSWRALSAFVLKNDIAKVAKFDGPVGVNLAFYFERPKSHLNGSGSLRKGYSSSHIVKPDLDKLVRAILDAGTDATVWHDDAQVVRLTASKQYVGSSGREALPGVRIQIWKEGTND